MHVVAPAHVTVIRGSPILLPLLMFLYAGNVPVPLSLYVVLRLLLIPFACVGAGAAVLPLTFHVMRSCSRWLPVPALFWLLVSHTAPLLPYLLLASAGATSGLLVLVLLQTSAAHLHATLLPPMLYVTTFPFTLLANAVAAPALSVQRHTAHVPTLPLTLRARAIAPLPCPYCKPAPLVHGNAIDHIVHGNVPSCAACQRRPRS